MTTHKRHGGLGRGLGALIPTEVPEESADLSRPTKKTETTLSRPVDVFFSGGGVSSNNETHHLATHKSAVEEVNEEARQKQSWVAASESGRLELHSLRPVPAHPKTGAENDQPELQPVPGAEFAELPIQEITPNPRQPRTSFEQNDLDELAASISEVGLLQPIVVRRLSPHHFELIMGERRWRAAQMAGLDLIPAIIRHTDNAEMLRDALIENLHRVNLNPIEEAAAYRQLLDDFGCTQEQLSEKVSRSRPQISNTLRLLKLPPLVQRRLVSGTISAGHARALLRLENPSAMEQLAQRIVAEGLSVRAVEELVTQPPEKERRISRMTSADPATEDLANRLSSRFGTRVAVRYGKNVGRVSFEFRNANDLNRILAVMAPEEMGLPIPIEPVD